MNQQEKWVELFKQVIGRVPSPQEFMAGKESGFDFKQIKAIAGELVEEKSPVEPVVPPTSSQNTSLNSGVVVNVGQVGSAPTQGSIPATFVQPKVPWSKKKKRAFVFGVAGAALLLALAGGFYYMDQKTGSDVAALELLDTINKEDYSGLAANFSSNQDKWKQADAKKFLAYLDSQTNVAAELEKMAEDPNYVYSDDRGNKLLGMKKTGDFLGLFPSYQVISYPFEVFAKTNVDSLILDKEKLPKNKEISLGSYPFISKEFHLTGKTEFGEVDTVLVPNMADAENNQVHISLNTTEKTIKATLPEELPTINEKKLFINGKEAATSLEKKVKVLENQHLSIHVQFNHEGATYTTDKVDLTVSPDKDTLVAELTVSDEIIEKIVDAQADKEAAAKKEKEREAKIPGFMKDYIQSMSDSIAARRVMFGQYFDTSSSIYRIYANYIENDVAQQRIAYRDYTDYTVTDIKKEGDDYLVTVRNHFTTTFTDGEKASKEKIQVFKLRVNGDSFLIYDLIGDA